MKNPMDLAGRRVLVTGASSGLGKETSRLLAGLGARIVAVGRNEQRLMETVASLGGHGHQAEAFDLCAIDEIPAWIKRLASDGGPFNGVVHSAGVERTLSLRNCDRGVVREVMEVNFEAAVALSRGFRQRGVCTPEGRIVYVSSVAGLTGNAGIAVYSASKGALISLVRALAVELAPEGIRVNTVAPGFIRTEMTGKILEKMTPEQIRVLEAKYPLKLGQPRDVAHAVAFLLSDTGRWITGTTLVVDGGYTAL